MTAEVRAWARETVARRHHEATCECMAVEIGGSPHDLDYDAAAAVLAVLPELLTDPRVVDIAARAVWGPNLDWHRADARQALTTAAETLASAS